MGFKALTINTPPESEAHILAEDDAALYAGMLAQDSVLNLGNKLKATVISNNKVRISDGIVLVGGHAGRIVKGDYEDMTISNGVSGQKRNDIIVARFIAGASGGADSYKLVVIQGTSGTTAKDPVYTKGDLYNGDKQRDYPLWRVKIENLSIVKVEQMFTVGKSTDEVTHFFASKMADMNEILKKQMADMNEALQKQITAKCAATAMGGYNNEWQLTQEWKQIGNYIPGEETDYYKNVQGSEGYIEIKQNGVYLLIMQASVHKKTSETSGTIWSEIRASEHDLGGDTHFMPIGAYYDTLKFVTYQYLTAGARLKLYIGVDQALTGVYSVGKEYLNIIRL